MISFFSSHNSQAEEDAGEHVCGCDVLFIGILIFFPFYLCTVRNKFFISSRVIHSFTSIRTYTILIHHINIIMLYSFVVMLILYISIQTLIHFFYIIFCLHPSNFISHIAFMIEGYFRRKSLHQLMAHKHS